MTLWSGRVENEVAQAVWDFLRADDAELLPYDCLATRVHARRLYEGGLLSDEEALEVHRLGARGIEALRAEYEPHGHNLGWNLGRVAGAGIEDHVHLHVVPRWNGDTSFMPVLADVKVLPEALRRTAERLRPHFA